MKAAKIVLIYAFVVLILAITVQSFRIPDAVGKAVASRLDPLIASIGDNNRKFGKLMDTLQTNVDDMYWDIKASVESSTAATKSTALLIADTRAQLNGGVDSNGKTWAGLLPQVESELGTFKSLTAEMQRDVKMLTGDSDQSVKALTNTLNSISQLSNTMDAQIKLGSPLAQQTFQQLNKAIADLDKLLADPNVAQALAHVNSSTQSIDQALLPWRQKASQLKMILEKIFTVFKVVWKL